MFADISHERQQSLLRQRNLFALTSAGLGIALVVAVSLAGLVTDLCRSPERLELATGDRRDDEAFS